MKFSPRTDDEKELAAVILNLPPELRAIYVMSHSLKKTRQEIASALKVDLEYVFSLAVEAQKTVRERLDGRVTFDVFSPEQTQRYRETLQKAGISQAVIDRLAPV